MLVKGLQDFSYEYVRAMHIFVKLSNALLREDEMHQGEENFIQSKEV